MLAILNDESGKMSIAKVISLYVVVTLITPLIYAGIFLPPTTQNFIISALGWLAGIVTGLIGTAQIRTALIKKKADRAALTVAAVKALGDNKK